MSKIDIDHFVKLCNDPHKERTRRRLEEIEKLGMSEVGVAEFGLPGKMSGLYVERVWNYSDEDWKRYVDWVRTFLVSTKCDGCGKDVFGPTYPVYDDNYNKQEGLEMCAECAFTNPDA